MAEALPHIRHQEARDQDLSSTISQSVLSHLKQLHQALSTPGLRKEFGSETQGDGDTAVYSASRNQDDPLAPFDDFLKYITGPNGNVEKPPAAEDFSFPIASYFISTSHNTYLTGNQLYSEASTDPYKNVLLRGCRCLEIDVWDGVHPSQNQAETTGDITTTTPTENATNQTAIPALEDSFTSQTQKGTSASTNISRMGSISNRFSRLMRRSTFAGTKSNQEQEKAKPEAPVRGGGVEAGKRTSRLEPRVLHGHTLTKEVPFRDVCNAIRDSAFVNSDLPVIVSLEVHANHDQQGIMVEIMREAWDGFLVHPTEELDTPDCKMPRLVDLYRRILIKVKWAPPISGAAMGDVVLAADGPLQHIPTTGSIPEGQEPPSKKPKGGGIINDLRRLAIYTRAYHFSGFTQAEATIPTHVFSLSESAVRHARETDEKAIRSHNKKYLMRVFPSGTRVTSSNLDPTPCWRVGSQMVALNWQRSDKGMMLNHAMFAGTGGWVLKPKGYRESSYSEPASPLHSTHAKFDVYRIFDFTLDVLAGQQIPITSLGKDFSVSSFRPYVKCQLHISTSDLQRVDDDDSSSSSSVDKEDKKSKPKQRTKTSRSRSPDFGGERLEFRQMSKVIPELSFVRLKIHHEESFRSDKLVAWACIRLDRLRTGYRLVGLRDASTGAQTTGSVLVNLQVRYQK